MKTTILRIDEASGEQLMRAAKDAANGAVLVFPTDTVYGIGTNPFNPAAVRRVFEIKQRPNSKPLPVLFSDEAQAAKATLFNDEAKSVAAKFWPGALTMILRASPYGMPLSDNGTVAVRVPAHEWLRSLIRAMGTPLNATSANISGSPVISDNARLLAEFDGKADYIFLAETCGGLASTIVDLSKDKPAILRAGAADPRAVLDAAAGK